MTASWPGTLPQKPNRNAFGEQRQRNVAAFTPDVGTPKMRRRSTAVGVISTMTFQMSDAQVATFDTFYETTLVDGTLPFTWNHPITNTGYTWIFASDQAPQKDVAGNNYNTVTFKLLRLP